MPEFVTPDVWIKGGLLDRKHIDTMGDAIWLYLYLQSIVRRTGEHAGQLPAGQLYQHQDAMEALGVPRRRIERWFAVLTATPNSNSDGAEPAYVVATRRRLGYEITITKYEDLRERAAQRRLRPATSGGSHEQESPPEGGPEMEHESGLETRHFEGQDPPHLAYQDPPLLTQDPPLSVARPATFDARPATSGVSHETTTKERARLSTDSTDQQEELRTRARVLTPEQELINAWMLANGREPTKAPDFARHITVAQELAARGDTPQDVTNCTKYLRTDPWRLEKGRPPSLADVRDALPGWRELKRPAKYQPAASRPAAGVQANGVYVSPAAFSKGPPPPEHHMTPEEAAASDAAREQVKQQLAAHGLAGRARQIGQIGRVPS